MVNGQLGGCLTSAAVNVLYMLFNWRLRLKHLVCICSAAACSTMSIPDPFIQSNSLAQTAVKQSIILNLSRSTKPLYWNY